MMMVVLVRLARLAALLRRIGLLRQVHQRLQGLAVQGGRGRAGEAVAAGCARGGRVRNRARIQGGIDRHGGRGLRLLCGVKLAEIALRRAANRIDSHAALSFSPRAPVTRDAISVAKIVPPQCGRGQRARTGKTR
jgi:hypothetical protein